MPKNVFFYLGILCIPLLILTGCANSPQSELQTIFVGPIQIPCEGASPQLCLLVKSNPTDHFELFYDQIIGFEYEPGFTYELQVTEETIDDPPADSPSIRLILEKVVDRVEASSPLEGSFWELQSYRDENGTLQDALPQVQTNLKFNTLEIGGSSGCNTYFGSYTVDGEWIFVGVLANTEIFCEEPEGVMEQERSFLSGLSNAQTYQITGDELNIINSEGDVLLSFKRVEATPLVGTNWVLTGYNNGMGGFVSLIGGTHVSAVFGEDGILSGSGGCNAYNAAYQVSDNQIRIEAPVSTRMFCGSPEGTMIQENAYLSALETSNTYEIQGNQLIILAENGELALAYISNQNPNSEIGLGSTVWAWQSSLYNDGNNATPEEPGNYTVEFLSGGNLSVKADCNMVSGEYSVEESSISIEITASTLVACEPGSLSDQFIKDLTAAALYFFQDESLFIDMKFDRGTMNFSPVE